MNMVQLKNGEHNVRAYFDMDHKTGDITNVEVIDHRNKSLPLSDRDLEAVVDLLNEEVQLAILDLALFAKGGVKFNA